MSEKNRPPNGPEWPGLDESTVVRNATKRKLLDHGLDKGVVHIQLDARYPGVSVPAKHASDEALVLKLSRRFANTDLVVNERGLAATLRFSGQPHRCVVPWPAIWGVLLEGMPSSRRWLEDLPAELGGPSVPSAVVAGPPVEPVRPKLQLISDAPPEVPLETPEANETPAVPVAEEPSEPSESKPRAPWLRLVR